MYFLGIFYIQIVIGKYTKLTIRTEISEYKVLVIFINTLKKNLLCVFFNCMIIFMYSVQS